MSATLHLDQEPLQLNTSHIRSYIMFTTDGKLPGYYMLVNSYKFCESSNSNWP
jgi:hypothetical protein